MNHSGQELNGHLLFISQPHQSTDRKKTIHHPHTTVGLSACLTLYISHTQSPEGPADNSGSESSEMSQKAYGWWKFVSKAGRGCLKHSLMKLKQRPGLRGGTTNIHWLVMLLH